MPTANSALLPTLCMLALSGLPLAAVPLRAQLAPRVAVERHDLHAIGPGRPGDAGPGRSTARTVLRVAGGTVLGAVIGGGAGYVVGAVRCGRRKDCAPAEAYPYPRFGAIAGAVVGGGIAWGNARATARPASALRSTAAGVAGALVPPALARLALGARRPAISLTVRVPVPTVRR